MVSACMLKSLIVSNYHLALQRCHLLENEVYPKLWVLLEDSWHVRYSRVFLLDGYFCEVRSRWRTAVMGDTWRMVRRTESIAVDIAIDKPRVMHGRVAGCRRRTSVDVLVACCGCWVSTDLVTGLF